MFLCGSIDFVEFPARGNGVCRVVVLRRLVELTACKLHRPPLETNTIYSIPAGNPLKLNLLYPYAQKFHLLDYLGQFLLEKLLAHLLEDDVLGLW